MPCPQCGELAEIGFKKSTETFFVEWDKIETQEGVDIAGTANTARLVCPHCGHTVCDDMEKNKMVSSDAAEWISDNPLADQAHQGYHLNSLYSSYVSIKEAARQFLEAKAVNQLQDFRNSFQALPWKHDTEDLPDMVKLKD